MSAVIENIYILQLERPECLLLIIITSFLASYLCHSEMGKLSQESFFNILAIMLLYYRHLNCLHTFTS